MLKSNDGMTTNRFLYDLCDQIDQFEMDDKGGSVSESDDESTSKDVQGRKTNILELSSRNFNIDMLSPEDY